MSDSLNDACNNLRFERLKTWWDLIRKIWDIYVVGFVGFFTNIRIQIGTFFGMRWHMNWEWHRVSVFGKCKWMNSKFEVRRERKGAEE